MSRTIVLTVQTKLFSNLCFNKTIFPAQFNKMSIKINKTTISFICKLKKALRTLARYCLSKCIVSIKFYSRYSFAIHRKNFIRIELSPFTNISSILHSLFIIREFIRAFELTLYSSLWEAYRFRNRVSSERSKHRRWFMCETFECYALAR